jgi:RNA polymerase sigma-70 factor, ECF subfamily
VAVAELDGAQVALSLVDGLDLPGYYAFHAVRGDLLRRLGRSDQAADAYAAALALTENEPEREFLRGRLAEVADPSA